MLLYDWTCFVCSRDFTLFVTLGNVRENGSLSARERHAESPLINKQKCVSGMFGLFCASKLHQKRKRQIQFIRNVGIVSAKWMHTTFTLKSQSISAHNSRYRAATAKPVNSNYNLANINRHFLCENRKAIAAFAWSKLSSEEETIRAKCPILYCRRFHWNRNQRRSFNELWISQPPQELDSTPRSSARHAIDFEWDLHIPRQVFSCFTCLLRSSPPCVSLGRLVIEHEFDRVNK